MLRREYPFKNTTEEWNTWICSASRDTPPFPKRRRSLGALSHEWLGPKVLREEDRIQYWRTAVNSPIGSYKLDLCLFKWRSLFRGPSSSVTLVRGTLVVVGSPLSWRQFIAELNAECQGVTLGSSRLQLAKHLVLSFHRPCPAPYRRDPPKS